MCIRDSSWSSWYNQPTAQIYHVAVTNTFPYRVCGGQQESGSVCISSRGNDGAITYREWHPVGAIEYGYVAPDPLDPDVIYGGGRSEVSKFYFSTGQVQNITPIPLRSPKYRTDRTEPLIFSPLDPHTLYFASNVLFKTTDGGNAWQIISDDLTRENPGVPASVDSLIPKGADKQRGVVYALAPSFKNVNTLWAGTDDGLIWLTRDGGKKWNNITPPELTPWSKVTQISASHFDDDTAYASVSRFRINDERPYIYRTHDGGKTWTLITVGLPDFGPVDTVREDPARKGLLFAGTENSVWVSFDDGDHWQSLQLNLPHTSMRDLLIHDNDLIVATHGRSFWILDDISPLRQIDAAVLKADAHLFNPALAYRVRRDTNTDTPLPPDEPAGQNPPDKVVLDYYFATPARGEVAVEILDSKNLIVRRFSTTDKPEVTEEDLEKQLIPLYWLRPERKLQTGAGMHRWLWDLRYPPPDSAHHGYPIAAVPGDTPRVPLGPSALPGEYTVRLSANGATYTAPLTVKMDPRVKATMIDLAQQLQTQSELADLLSRSSAALLQARSLSKELDDRSERAAGALKNAIADLQKKLIAAIGDPAAQSANGMKNPTLTSVNGQVGTLYDQLDRADAAPTPAQSKATANLSAAFGSAIGGWDDIVESDLPALNKELLGANLQQIRIEAHPQREEVPQGDEE